MPPDNLGLIATVNFWTTEGVRGTFGEISIEINK